MSTAGTHALGPVGNGCAKPGTRRYLAMVGGVHLRMEFAPRWRCRSLPRLLTKSCKPNGLRLQRRSGGDDDVAPERCVTLVRPSRTGPRLFKSPTARPRMSRSTGLNGYRYGHGCCLPQTSSPWRPSLQLAPAHRRSGQQLMSGYDAAQTLGVSRQRLGQARRQGLRCRLNAARRWRCCCTCEQSMTIANAREERAGARPARGPLTT